MFARSSLRFLILLAASLMVFGVATNAATITGTVTNGTNGKPSAGDSVVLVDVQAGMVDAGSTITDARGHYSLESPGMGVYLIRVTHQSGSYFIAAPQGGPGDITVYDVAAKVDGVAIDADMLLVEAAGDMLRVRERYMVRNTSLPPRTQFSNYTFEVALPDGAQLDGADATRPGGMATNTHLTPVGQSGHYTFNVPIQPDKGEAETVFELQYHLSYTGKQTFTPHLQMPADNLVVYVPNGMAFGGAQGTAFQSTPQDPRVQTFVAKSIRPGQAISFVISGEGQMPRDTQGGRVQNGGGMADSGTSNRPGGGLGVPIDTPDPFTKYKWWLLGGMFLLLVAGARYMLRNRAPLVVAGATAQAHDALIESPPLRAFLRTDASKRRETSGSQQTGIELGGQAMLLNLIKEELFAVESEKLSGALSSDEYAEVKAGLQALLRRSLKVKGTGRTSTELK
jgi:hypothetical protein